MNSHLDLHFDLLPHSLRFASLSIHDIHSNTAALLSSLFYSPPSKDPNGRFFSYTETPSELSLVLDSDSLALLIPQLLPDTNLVIGDAEWRAICLQEGTSESMAQMEVSAGLVTLMSKTLAERGISIFYLSTFQCDYVLCKADELERVTAVLENLVAPTPVAPSPQSHHAAPALDMTNTRLSIRHVPVPLALLSVSSSDIVPLTRPLIQATFFPPSSSRSQRFFSFSDIEGVVSLIVDIPSLSMLEHFDPRFCNVERWHAFHIKGTFGFDEVGLVYSVSKPLTEHKILPFYLSLFHTDYFMVQERKLKESVKLLKEKFNLELEGQQENGQGQGQGDGSVQGELVGDDDSGQGEFDPNEVEEEKFSG